LLSKRFFRWSTIYDSGISDLDASETQLRILTILGILESNYDAAVARETWAEIESLAVRRRHLLLAPRAVGEQGFAAFLLGDIATANKDVLREWTEVKFADPARVPLNKPGLCRDKDV
jgi:hypothetical protein